ncbi:MAG: hypothetical protein OXB84_02925 [Halobacteriovoraceae bacterium]|nr:hypothetical protein [Halobacteriovoraceae bacterium]
MKNLHILKGTIMDDFIEKIDHTYSSYKENPRQIFKNDSDQRKFVQNMQKNIKRLENHPPVVNHCCFPDCAQPPIKSHTIQKSGFLDGIAEAGNLVTLRSNLFRIISDEKPYESVKVGASEASTFYGFCENHEKEFDFERKKSISTERDEIRQQFRTICREINAKKKEIESYKKIKSLLDDQINSWAKGPMSPYLSMFPNMKLSIPEAHDENDNKVKELEEYLKYIDNNFYTPFYDSIESGIHPMSCVVAEMKVAIPINLSGISKIRYYTTQGVPMYNYIALSIISGGKKTLFIASSNRADAIRSYITYLEKPMGILNAIESWMIYGSTHWFIKPSVWDNFPSKKKNRILRDITKKNMYVNDELEYSIFDSYRREILSYNSTENQQMLKKEYDKLDYF